MANLSLTRVNQKLAQAKVLLKSGSADDSVLITYSILEATAFHLVCAYRHYLNEIAETYGVVPVFDLQNEIDLMRAFESANKFPSEAKELTALKEDANSWLSQLQQYYDSLWLPPSSLKVDQSDELRINLVDLDKPFSASAITYNHLQYWCDAFLELVRRHRETSAEF